MKTLFIFYVIFSGLVMVGITLTNIKHNEPNLNKITKILSCIFNFPIGFIVFPILLGSIMTKVVTYINKYK